ncbi:MAG TPA: GntR family transcriptional regulator [Methylomirabilota bacterium]|nr:GntR family transcriptional regulator [Methylomirabilota bacterium]
MSKATDSRIRFADPGLIRDRVVHALREAIIAGRLKPGERIRERELVSLLGVSRSPLREAIRILETEGLITSLAHRGARVSELSAVDLHDMLDVRIMLESFAARLFIERLDEAVLRAMEEQVERSRAPGYRVDLQENFDLGLEFHDLLVGACGNRKVVQLHENLRRHQTRYQHFAFARLGRDVRALDEHAEMVAMLRARDLGAVERLMRAHLLRFHDYLAPLLPVDAAADPEPR